MEYNSADFRAVAPIYNSKVISRNGTHLVASLLFFLGWRFGFLINQKQSKIIFQNILTPLWISYAEP